MFNKRIAAAFIDTFVIGAILGPISVVFSGKWFSPYLLIMLVICCWLFKDIVFGNASLGKVCVSLRVVHAEGEGKPRVRQLIIRNIPSLVIPAYEFHLLREDYVSRLGDQWAKTKVICLHDDMK
ncbi:MAG: RDD family protein [Clostridia bacterium]|nr:RDD family protein [Clostridia bacterium]MBQ9131108.1 RDD family protein [Clostridia bacterium]